MIALSQKALNWPLQDWESMDRIAGVFPAVSTPISADGMPDLPRMAAHCRALLDDGATGLAVLGSTGEANSFSVSERCAIIEGLIARGIAAELLMPGTGTCAVPDTASLVKNGLALGVTRFVMLPPFYYKGISDEGLFAAYGQVVEKVGDARIRLILYHFPALSGVAISVDLVGRLREAYPDLIAGMKDSTGSLQHALAIIRAHSGFSLLAGADPVMLPTLPWGGAGCITALSNLAVREMAFMFENHALAMKVAPIQERITAMRNFTTNGVQLTNIKALLARRYGDAAWLRVRPPFVVPDAAQVEYVEACMAGIDRLYPFDGGDDA